MRPRNDLERAFFIPKIMKEYELKPISFKQNDYKKQFQRISELKKQLWFAASDTTTNGIRTIIFKRYK